MRELRFDDEHINWAMLMHSAMEDDFAATGGKMSVVVNRSEKIIIKEEYFWNRKQ